MAMPSTAAPPLKTLFPWPGGKTLAAPLIWQALGNCPNYVEAFFGAGATLFLRPHAPTIETINDKDAYVCNVFRALRAAPEEVAQWCDWPVNEADQHAIHTWLVGQRETFTARLMGAPDYYDAQVAGRWLYGICMWIGRDWCSGKGAWQSIDGQLVHVGTTKQGVHHQLPHLGNAGHGVHRQRVHLGSQGTGGTNYGHGVHAKRAHGEGLRTWFAAIQQRLRYVRVCCGDWTRVMGPSVTWRHGLTGILMDPPYSAEEGRDPNLYRMEDPQVAHAVRAWCLANGSNKLLRIVLCGYGDVHDELLEHGWRKVGWTANGGYGNQRQDGTYANKYRETLWLSPACLSTEPERQLPLF
jgi:D12 class N6 adenine-specific DNA methyltransferase